MREHDDDFSPYPEPFSRPRPGRRGRLTEEQRGRLARVLEDTESDDGPPGGADRWSTWGAAQRGPHPRPDWVVTDLAATDTDLGMLKGGKEADVHLLRRAVPGGRACLLAAKRYRTPEHRLFHRDSGYLEGRRMRRSRETRAMAARSSYGRNLIAEQWAVAEFAALARLWSAGLPVPYPVQRDGTELLLEFVGSEDGTAAPRLAQLRPGPRELRSLWWQVVEVLHAVAALGLTHGDLSAYNILVADGKVVLIDLPQVVDLVAHPGGTEYLVRDVQTVARWFQSHGLPAESLDFEHLLDDLLRRAGR